MHQSAIINVLQRFSWTIKAACFQTVHRAWGVRFSSVDLGAARGPGREGWNAVQRWDVVDESDLFCRITCKASEKFARLLHDFVRVATVLAPAVNEGTEG